MLPAGNCSEAFNCRHTSSCPARNANANTPEAISPDSTLSASPRRAARLVHWNAALLRTSMTVLTHSRSGAESGRQSASSIRIP